MFLRFLDNLEKTYEITGEVKQLSSNKVCIYQNDIPENISGFEIVANDETVTSYNDYTVVYRKKDDHIVFTSDTKNHYVYYIYNENGYVSSYMLTVREVNKPNTIFVRSGQGSFYENVPSEEYLDENGIYKYKVVNGELVEITEDEKNDLIEAKLQKVKVEKIAILSSICGENINKGIQYEDKWYSGKLEDVSNWESLYTYAKVTNMPLPYHPDDNSCREYSASEIQDILLSLYGNKFHNLTYFNQLKMYILTLNTIDEIEPIYYGQELTGVYLDTYNSMMTLVQKAMETYISSLSV